MKVLQATFFTGLAEEETSKNLFGNCPQCKEVKEGPYPGRYEFVVSFYIPK